jgi:pimeloyl-ACP methyl ester carboxylesterase
MSEMSTAATPDQLATLFITPQRRPRPQVGIDDAQRRDVTTRHGRVAIWERGTGPSVLLVHGWEGSARDMAAVAAQLSGMRVIALDLPAHGESEGKQLSIPQGAEVLLDVQQACGPFDAAVCHSVGCAMTVEAVRDGLGLRALVLMAPPARYLDYAYGFGKQAGLDRAQIGAMLDTLKQRGLDVAKVDTPKVARAIDLPVMVLHARDDNVIPQAIGQEVAAAFPNAQFVGLDDGGHRRILGAPGALQVLQEFLAPLLM